MDSNPWTPYKVYNIGNSSPVNLMDFIKAIEKALGKKAKMNMLPMQPDPDSHRDAKNHSDVTDLMEYLSYKPNTTVGKGIDRFVVWYREYYK